MNTLLPLFHAISLVHRGPLSSSNGSEVTCLRTERELQNARPGVLLLLHFSAILMLLDIEEPEAGIMIVSAG